jgi:hypothetical protein
MRRELEPDVEAALLDRAHEAIERAAQIQRGSQVLVEISAALREGRLTARCAWCGRYRVGGEWVLVEAMPALATFAAATHGICEECLEALRAAGLSA